MASEMCNENSKKFLSLHKAILLEKRTNIPRTITSKYNNVALTNIDKLRRADNYKL